MVNSFIIPFNEESREELKKVLENVLKVCEECGINAFAIKRSLERIYELPSYQEILIESLELKKLILKKKLIIKF